VNALASNTPALWRLKCPFEWIWHPLKINRSHTSVSGGWKVLQPDEKFTTGALKNIFELKE
jgi:hypothetical protein